MRTGALDAFSVSEMLKSRKIHLFRRLLGGRRYSLSKSFQLRENRLTIKLMFPMSVIHTVGFMLYLVFAATARRFSSQMEATDFALLLEGVHSVGVFLRRALHSLF